MDAAERLADAGLVKGTTLGIDATTLEAKAALRSIVRRDTGESYQDFLTKLAHPLGRTFSLYLSAGELRGAAMQLHAYRVRSLPPKNRLAPHQQFDTQAFERLLHLLLKQLAI